MSMLNLEVDMSEKQRICQELLDVRCLQLLRAIIHNEIVKLPANWEENMGRNARYGSLTLTLTVILQIGHHILSASQKCSRDDSV